MISGESLGDIQSLIHGIAYGDTPMEQVLFRILVVVNRPDGPSNPAEFHRAGLAFIELGNEMVRKTSP